MNGFFLYRSSILPELFPFYHKRKPYVLIEIAQNDCSVLLWRQKK